MAHGVSRRRVVGALGAAGVSLGLGGRVVRGARAQEVDRGKTLIIALNGGVTDLDPHSAFDLRSAYPLQGIYEGLIQLRGAATDAYEPLLAESWSPNADLSVWTFAIRPGVTFSDGTACDAAAVKASFDRMLAMGLGPAYTFNRFVTDAGQVTAPDAATVVFDLGRPQPAFEAFMASTYGVKVANAARAEAEAVDGDFGHGWAMFAAEGMGTGPYALTSYEVDQELVLDRNPAYWREWADDQFERIVIRVVPEIETRRQLVEAGDVDIVDNLTPEADAELAGNPDVAVVQAPVAGVAYLTMAVTGPLATPAARRALCYAFPYREVIDGVMLGRSGEPSGAVPQALRGYDPDTFVYGTDLERARALLAEAGVAGGTTLTMMLEEGDTDAASMASLFQANLQGLGVALEVQTVSTATLVTTIFRDASAEEQPSLTAFTWWPSYNDAYDHLLSLVTTGAQGSAGANSGYYGNAEVDRLMAAAGAAETEAEYVAALSEVQRIVQEEDPPAIWYRQLVWSTVHRADVAGYVSNPVNIGTVDFWALRRVGG